ncbi:hypothetical protein SODALDRAFT_12176 [Sodiomyces alkalinus F11]|uniref:PCI domain-containing protein n=1 Tax=Sodiomyces alkalinus (strain CBS 110278 / VKM F-3762 / F11) TaxID=1314773 RepID=A0A3N2Q6C7_SODAK|nr:hypothetical protein SODALDRAFT_12176 [Sodiomyces alkalinus F11]ROT42302.1 hypothetical protein SODALDRAFT_12176 [Sodiomyces alkalinus F11]
MEQTKALNALEPFLALTKSATSPRAAADLVTRATSHPNTFLFTELLCTPQIQSLSQSPQFARHLTLLEIFSYGTYADYQQSLQQHQQQQSQPPLPPLNESQTLKLRQLTLLTLARDRANLTYPRLQSALGLPDSRALESLVTLAVYAGLLTATLDPARQYVQVNALSPLRDLRPGAVADLVSPLRTWSDRCTTTLRDIEVQTAEIRANAARRHRESAARDAKLARLVDEAKAVPSEGASGGDRSRRSGPRATTSYSLRGGRGRALNKRASNLMEGTDAVDDETMDVDQEEEEQKRASRRKL